MCVMVLQKGESRDEEGLQQQGHFVVQHEQIEEQENCRKMSEFFKIKFIDTSHEWTIVVKIWFLIRKITNFGKIRIQWGNEVRWQKDCNVNDEDLIINNSKNIQYFIDEGNVFHDFMKENCRFVKISNAIARDKTDIF